MTLTARPEPRALDLDAALTGISGILVTPYDEAGDIAPAQLAPILDRALGAGVHMPVVNGNTGEFYALTTDEAAAMVREVAAMVAGEPVSAGTEGDMAALSPARFSHREARVR